MHRNWFIIFLILSFSTNVKGQDSIPPTKQVYQFISVEAGGVYYGFRDEISSVLFYEGLGGAHLGVGYQRSKNNKSLDAVNIAFEYGEARAKVNDANDFTTILSFSVSYSKIWKFQSKKRSKINYFLGGGVSFNGLYIQYPLIFSNNGHAYTIDVPAFSPVAGISFSPNRNSKSTINLFTHLQLMSLNVRPESFSGVGSEKVFSERKVTRIHNNFRLKNTISYAIQTKRNRHFDIGYSWLLIWNNSRINALSYAQHNLTFRYQFKLKSRSK